MNLDYKVDINANVGNCNAREGGKFNDFAEKISKKLNESEHKAQKVRAEWASKNPQQAEFLKNKYKNDYTPKERAIKAATALGTTAVVGGIGAAATNAMRTAANKKVNDKLDKDGVTDKYQRDMANAIIGGVTTKAGQAIPNSYKAARNGSREGAIGQGLIGRTFDKNSDIFIKGLAPDQLDLLLKIIPSTDIEALHRDVPGSEGHEFAYIPIQTLNAMGW